MLKRIQCDEFKTFDGAIRPPIEFHKGLNAVIGNESGTNSVGKSTFLMILDFVFGGAEKYGLVSDGLTFRGAVSRFIRVDRRETMKEDKPFRSAERETDAAAILGMLKLYGRYGEVEQQEKVAAEAEDREDTFKAAQKYEYIPHVKNKTEYKRNKEKIITLQSHRRESGGKKF